MGEKTGRESGNIKIKCSGDSDISSDGNVNENNNVSNTKHRWLEGCNEQ